MRSLCSHVTLVSWRFSFLQRTFQTQALLSGAVSQCLGKHKLVWHYCHIYRPSSTSHCLKLQRNMEKVIVICSPLLEKTEDSFMKLLLDTEQKCRRKREKLSLSKTAETLHESAKLLHEVLHEASNIKVSLRASCYNLAVKYLFWRFKMKPIGPH